MSNSPILLLHIFAGTLGLLAGAVAIVFRKGSRRHGIAGRVFVFSMMALAASGVYMAIVKSQPGNILGGTLTFYLVATAWTTARRPDGKSATSDCAALLVVLAVTATDFTFGTQAAFSPTGQRYDYPPGPYFFLGSVALIATVGDLRLLFRHGIFGAQRVARHLWRMCFALFIASSSVFLARQRLFPALLRQTGALILLSVLPLLLMIYWLIRVLLTKYAKGSKVIRPANARIVSPSSASTASWSQTPG